jgi:hypothetical protein
LSRRTIKDLTGANDVRCCQLHFSPACPREKQQLRETRSKDSAENCADLEGQKGPKYEGRPNLQPRENKETTDLQEPHTKEIIDDDAELSIGHEAAPVMIPVGFAWRTRQTLPHRLAPRVRIVMRFGSDQETAELGSDQTVSIGRSGKLLSVSRGGPTVSRFHATMRWNYSLQAVELQDVGSFNGTFVNLGPVVKLTEGCILEIEQHEYLFERIDQARKEVTVKIYKSRLVSASGSVGKEFALNRFSRNMILGTAIDAEICVQDSCLSHHHAEVDFRYDEPHLRCFDHSK